MNPVDFCMFDETLTPELSLRENRAEMLSGSTGLGPAASASEIAYEEHVRFDALPAGAVQPPPPASGPDLRAWRYAALQTHAVLWGPVPAAEAARIAGAPAGCESVLLAPAVPFALHQDVVDLIPPSVKPLPTDTAETLAARLSESDFLDDIHFKAAGHGRGGRYVQINKTQYPQPRRVTWSVQLPEQMLYASMAASPRTSAAGQCLWQCISWGGIYGISPCHTLGRKVDFIHQQPAS